MIFAKPASYDQRAEMGQLCVVKLGIHFPAVVDTFDNSTERNYTGWPDRLYVVDRDGRIAYKSAPGPFGFHPDGVEKTLLQLLPSGPPVP